MKYLFYMLMALVGFVVLDTFKVVVLHIPDSPQTAAAIAIASKVIGQLFWTAFWYLYVPKKLYSAARRVIAFVAWKPQPGLPSDMNRRPSLVPSFSQATFQNLAMASGLVLLVALLVPLACALEIALQTVV